MGGLIKENKTQTEIKVPFLGDIPFFGALFRSKSSSKSRTELIVFIRPHVLRGDEAATAEARHRSEMLQAGKELHLHRIFEGKPVFDTGTDAGKEPPPATPAPTVTGTNAAPVKSPNKETTP